MKHLLLLTVLTAFSFLQLAQAAPAEKDKEKDKPVTVSFTGKVTHLDLEGGFWGIVADDGTKYDPKNLEADYQHEGLRVQVEATIQDGVSTHMWGKIIQITKISKAKPAEK